MQFKLSRVIMVVAFAVGCGGGGSGGGVDTGGVDSSKQLSSLSASDATSLCNALAAQFPPKEVSCGSDFTFNIGISGSDCGSGFDLPPAACMVTVGEAADCFQAEYDGGSAVLCGSSAPAACAPEETAACQGD